MRGKGGGNGKGGEGDGKGEKEKGGEGKGREDPLDLLPPEKFSSYATASTGICLRFRRSRDR